MANCLVTKLKGVVNNNNLLKVGEFRFPSVRNDFPAEGAHLKLAPKEGNIITVEDIDGNFVGKDYSVIEGTSSNIVNEFIAPGHRVKFISKYNLTSIELTGDVFGEDSVGIDELQFMPKLVFINMACLDFSGLNSSLEPLEDVALGNFTYPRGSAKIIDLVHFIPNIRDLRFSAGQNFSFKGELKDFAPLSSITKLQLGDRRLITGSVEDYVRAAVALGRNTGSLNALYWSHTQGTFNGEPISADNTQLSWQLNTNPSKIDVTFDSTTITIDA